MKAPPLPIALLAIVQALFGTAVASILSYLLLTSGYDIFGEIAHWVVPFGILSGLACLASAVQLWRLKWSGPVSFFALWWLPFLASLPFATLGEMFAEGTFIEGRISFLLLYAVVVFEFRRQFGSGATRTAT